MNNLLDIFPHSIFIMQPYLFYRPNNNGSNNTQFDHILQKIEDLQQKIRGLNITVGKTSKNLTVFQGKLKNEKKKLKQRHDDTEKEFVDLKDERNNLKTKVKSVSLMYKNIWSKGNKNNIMFSDFLDMIILYDTSLTHPIQYVHLRKMW